MEKRTGAEWNKEYKVKILDPDGWRRGDGVDFDETPITRADFIERVSECTVETLRADLLDGHRWF